MILRQQKMLSNNHYGFNQEKCKNSIFQKQIYLLCYFVPRRMRGMWD